MPDTEQESGNEIAKEDKKKNLKKDPWAKKKKRRYTEEDEKLRSLQTG